MSIYLGLKESAAAFDESHGNDPVIIGNWLLFADGAQRERQLMGAWLEPPSGDADRTQLVLRYHREKLAQATDAFQQLKDKLTFRANESIRHAGANTPPPPPSPEQIAELAAARSTVLEMRKAVDEAAERADGLKPPQRRERERLAVELAERGQTALEQIAAIQI
jgi:hypothetical protein